MGPDSYSNTVVWEWDGVRSQIRGFYVQFQYSGTSETYSQWYDERTHSLRPSYAAIGSMAQLFPLPRRPACEETLTIKVLAFAYEQFPEEYPRYSEGGWVPNPPGDYFVRTSAWSRPGHVYGPPCPHQAQIQVDLGRLYVESSRDVDGLEELCFFCAEDRTQEAYGQMLFFLNHQDGTRQMVANVGFWNTEICAGCFVLGEPDHYRGIHAGDYPLSDERLRFCTTAGSDSTSWNCNVYPESRAQPAFWVYVEEGDSLSANLTLWDDDDSTGDDVWCSGSDSTAEYTAQGWGDLDMPWAVTNSDLEADAPCYVDMHIVGHGITSTN